MPVNRTCPHCGETKPFFLGEPKRACDDCRRAHFFQGSGEDGEYGDIIKRWNAQEDREEERDRLKREKELVERDQMRLL